MVCVSREAQFDMIAYEPLPLVTAVVTTYHRPKLARRAIKSVLAQSYQSLEIVVVEDGSDSSISAWMDGLSAQVPIRYIRHQSNRGLAAARNTGLETANGVYVAYLDDDDEWLPDKLTRQVAHLQGLSDQPEVVYCGAEVVSRNGELIGSLKPRLEGDIRAAIRNHGLYTIPSSCLFRQDALMQIGGHDEDMFSHIDHDLWLKMAQENYTTCYVDRNLVRVHHHRGGRLTSDDDVRMKTADFFCQKWYPKLSIWYGETRAKRYCSRFKARVIAMLGWANLEAGNRWKSMHQFLTAIRYYPSHARHYRGVVASMLGFGLYNWAARWVKLWRNEQDC
jgi:glycosyltransferase involved in cell wall biosynthesis